MKATMFTVFVAGGNDSKRKGANEVEKKSSASNQGLMRFSLEERGGRPWLGGGMFKVFETLFHAVDG